MDFLENGADGADDISDEQLVFRTLENKEAYLSLMRRYEAKLLRYAHRLGIPEKDAEDVVQESFIKAYVNLRSFDPSLKFSSWIYRITHNAAMDYFRKASNRSEALLVDDERSALSWMASDLESDHEAKLSSDRQLLAKAMEGLDCKYREVLVLRYFEELDYVEIADVLRKPLGSVSTLLNRAKKKLKEKMKNPF
jgi:RNA polymerase sigma-70 factor (ECF subfamily)